MTTDYGKNEFGQPRTWRPETGAERSAVAPLSFVLPAITPGALEERACTAHHDGVDYLLVAFYDREQRPSIGVSYSTGLGWTWMFNRARTVTGDGLRDTLHEYTAEWPRELRYDIARLRAAYQDGALDADHLKVRVEV